MINIFCQTCTQFNVKDEYKSKNIYVFMLLIMKHSSISISLIRMVRLNLAPLFCFMYASHIDWQYIWDDKQKEKLKKLSTRCFFNIKDSLSKTIKLSSKYYQRMIFLVGSKVQTIHYDQSIVHSKMRERFYVDHDCHIILIIPICVSLLMPFINY